MKQACGADSQVCGQEPLRCTSARAGGSQAHSSTTSQPAPRSLTPVPTNRARIVQAERWARELGSEARGVLYRLYSVLRCLAVLLYTLYRHSGGVTMRVACIAVSDLYKTLYHTKLYHRTDTVDRPAQTPS